MLKRITSDPSLWFLIIFNLYLIWYYNQHPSDFKTLIWLYWLQSVMLGLLNTLDIFMLKNPDPQSLKIDGKLFGGGQTSKGCLGLFFLAHYGTFHLAYAIFLLVQILGSFDSTLFLLGAGLLLIEASFSFIKRRNWENHQKLVNVGTLFFTPYLRIIPMHLMILLPAFFGWSQVGIFLWLKTIADILTHIFINRARPRAAAII